MWNTSGRSCRISPTTVALRPLFYEVSVQPVMDAKNRQGVDFQYHDS